MKDIKNAKIAILHDFLVQFGGAEKVLESMSEVFPDAHIFTAKFDEKCLIHSPILQKMKIIKPKQNWVSKVSKYFFTFLMAPIFEEFDFSDYDIIISEGTAWPKGAITKPNQLHISYIHTPPRFLYGYSTESTKRNKWYFKLFFSYIDNLLRLWDFAAAQRPDFILANSNEIKNRIKKFYRRDATVMYPPVNVGYESEKLTNKEKEELSNLPRKYFLALGRLAAYKNFDKLINAFKHLDYKLVVVGTGTHEKFLRKMAPKNVIFTGRVSENQKHHIINNCQGLINPISDEDFGIVPLEVMGHKKPVLAHKSAGHLETIKEKVSGMFFESLNEKSLAESIKKFNQAIENKLFDGEEMEKWAQGFSNDVFKQKFEDFVIQKYQDLNA